MEDAARVTLEEWGQKLDVQVAVPRSWEKETQSQAAVPKSSGAVFRTYDDKGKLTNYSQVMQGLGFIAGAKVIRRGSEAPATIVAINHDEVTLKLEDGSTKFADCTSFFEASEWKIYSEAKPQVELQWLTDSPAVCEEFAIATLKAQVAVAMHQQLHTLKGWDTMRLFANPRSVTTPCKWGPRKLMLPCATPRISVVPLSKGTDGMVIGLFRDSYAVVSTACNRVSEDGKGGQGFQNPFWALGKTSEPTDANMEARRFQNVVIGLAPGGSLMHGLISLIGCCFLFHSF